MKKPKVVEPPRLGLVDPNKPTKVVDFDVEKGVEKWLKKVSKLSNHTISSIITVLLAVRMINLEPEIKVVAAKKQTVKTRL